MYVCEFVCFVFTYSYEQTKRGEVFRWNSTRAVVHGMFQMEFREEVQCCEESLGKKSMGLKSCVGLQYM